MGSQNGDHLSPVELVETKEQNPKKAKITYSRKVLLSLSELDICSKLPRGFDSSILKEFEKAADSVPERSNSRRRESGSFPPTSGDSSNLSQGDSGRWVNRFSALNDKNSDSPLDSESDFGKRYGNPSRTWQNAELDGLLGSGSSKSSMFTNASVTEVRKSGPYQLNKCNEPYQPPRPFKAASHLRRDVTDLINEETFGSCENSSQDRAEEEKKRRAYFEQFRKEHKAIHETQESDTHKENVDPDIAALNDTKLWDKNIKPEDMTPKNLQGESFWCSTASQTLASRPLAPPGFTTVTQEKKVGDCGEIRSNVTVTGNSNSVVNEKPLPHVDFGEQQYEIKTVHSLLTDINEKSVMDIASPECSTSILDRLFSKVSVVDSGFSNFSKPGDVNADTGSSIPFQASKFPDWYPQEEKRSETELSSGKPGELLSLVVNCGKDGSQLSRVSDQKTSILPLGTSDLTNRSGTATSCTVGILEPPYQSENSGASQGVLTCEDLEQSILSELSENNSRLDQSFESSGGIDAKAKKRPEVDNHASQHLLSLLQKGTSVGNSVQSTIHEAWSNHVYESGFVNSIQNSTVEDFEKVAKSEPDLTLEMLLGKAFMKELQSVKAPVSGQSGSIGGITQTNRTTLDGDPVSSLMEQMKSIKDEEVCLGFDASQDKVESNHGTISANDKVEEALGIQLPDEDSLFTYDAFGDTSNADLLSSSSTSFDIPDKIAAPNATLEKERSSVPVFDDPSILRGPYDPVEPEKLYQNRHGQPTSQFAHQQMIHGRTSFQPSDSYPSQMNIPSKVMGLESVLHPEFSQPNFPANVIHPPFGHMNSLPTRFSPPQPPMLQQMPMQGNMLHPHPLYGWPRGPPMPPYAINPMCVYTCEPNTMLNLPFYYQQNYSAIEMPIQGHAVGGGGNNRPKASVKWNQMERRANFRQIHPAARKSHGH